MDEAWAVIYVSETEIHVVPIHDEFDHDFSPRCICKVHWGVSWCEEHQHQDAWIMTHQVISASGTM